MMTADQFTPKKRMRISTSITIGVVAFVALVTIAMGITAAIECVKSAKTASRDAIPAAAEMAAEALGNGLYRYESLSSELASNPAVYTTAEDSAEARTTFLDSKAEALSVESIQFLNANGVSEKTGESFADSEFFIRAAAGETYVSSPVSTGAGDALYISSPVYANGVAGGELVGVVALSAPRSTVDDIIALVKVSASSQAFVLDKNGQYIACSGASGAKLGSAASEDKGFAPVVSKAVSGAAGESEASIGGKAANFAYVPVSNSDGWSLLVAVPDSDANATANRAIIICAIWMFGATGLAVVIAKMLTGKLTSTIDVVVERMGKFADGDVSSPMPDVNATSKELFALKDCIIKAVDNTSAVIGDVRYMLGTIAGGDFSVDTKAEEKYVGDYAEILAAEKLIRDELSGTLYEIDEVSAQVSAGSEQMSNGAQSIAQGATEQASSVEALSSTTEDVVRQIKESAQIADKANTLTLESREIMQGTISAMAEAKTAMDKISETSNDISKVIKAIDDIAFQTNILALNAAVEAARAGAAGKGFAVVADEVRNLSQKSAEAAKNTTVLIESSMEAVSKGNRLVGKASDDFAIVAEKSYQISDIVAAMNEQFHQQAIAANNISTGISQVASVIQMNSATSEESAAASQELTGQATVLKELVSKFKLNNCD